MKWFYFVDSSGKKYYAKTRKEAEQARKEAGCGSVIIETDIPPSVPPTVSQSSPSSAGGRNSGQGTVTEFKNDIAWLRRSGELVYGQSQLVPALQIYHPTRSHLHSQNDKRILQLKDSSRPAIAHYCAALKKVLPLNETILLCCAPGSTPSANSGITEIIKMISGGPLVDGSRVLRAIGVRKRKNNGARFGDDELSSYLEINPISLPSHARILLIDDVVTSGQTLRVCVSGLRLKYPNFRISCLALSSTDYNSNVAGIADRIELRSMEDAMKPLHLPPSRDVSGARHSTASSAAPATHENNQLAARPRNIGIQHKRPVAASGKNRQQASSTSDCFVVTAIYEGDASHPNVIRLRNFRDKRISSLPLGNKAIWIYKKYGPILAGAIAGTALSRQLRKALDYCLEKGGRG